MDASSLIVFVVAYYFICMSESSILEIKLILQALYWCT